MTTVAKNRMNKFILLVFIPLSILGCSKNGETLLNAYECDKKSFSLLNEDYLNCSGSCKKITWEDEEDKSSKNIKLTIGITVDKEGSKVLHKIYKNKEIVQSEIFENCKIFDNKNWDCSSKESFMNTRNDKTLKMNNGIFINHWEKVYFYPKSIKEEVFYALCGK